jgi:hypothetical protein
MGRVRPVNLEITNPKAIFTNYFTGTSADSYIAINTAVTNAGAGSSLVLNDGANVKNVGVNTFLIKTDDTSHGANTGFILAQNEELFVEVNDLSKLFVKNNTAGQGISFSVYSN